MVFPRWRGECGTRDPRGRCGRHDDILDGVPNRGVEAPEWPVTCSCFVPAIQAALPAGIALCRAEHPVCRLRDAP